MICYSVLYPRVWALGETASLAQVHPLLHGLCEALPEERSGSSAGLRWGLPAHEGHHRGGPGPAAPRGPGPGPGPRSARSVPGAPCPPPLVHSLQDDGVPIPTTGNLAAAHEWYAKAVDITPEVAQGLLEALRSEGIDFLVAPYEADAQLAFLVGLQVRAGTGLSRLLTAPPWPHRR